MNIRHILIALIIAICPAVSAAQEIHQFYVDAGKAFETGNFLEADTLLSSRVQFLDNEEQIQAYRLLALSNLYMDRLENAEIYTGKLLKLDPFYTAYGDSPRFADMLEKLKKGVSTITTASMFAETEEEVPVPVTLITEGMIKASGAVKLQDILLLYIPGLSAISSLEDNVAMRGVYGLGQETILVMLDGHRINSASTNSISFDFRNSIDKIKQIEVLRGPASSLYGNVALTAVVNIITKTGIEMDGGRLSAMAGSNSSFGGSFSAGKGNLKSEFFTWASVYNSKGEEIYLNNTKHYLGGYNNKPTYDLGTNIKWGDFKMSVSTRNSHPVPFYNLLCIGNLFSYDKYGKIDGGKPGISRNTFRIDAEMNHKWDQFTLSASAFMVSERSQLYNSISDTVDYTIMAYIAKLMNIQSVKTRGVRQSFVWEDYSVGGSVSGAYEYSLGKMNGSMLAGLQYENLAFGDATLLIGADFTTTNNVLHGIVDDGTEHTLSAFLQLKHYFTKKFILNGGLRYDFKKRIDGRTINTASPRISLIWLPTSIVTVKGGYSRSFVDAPAFYRVSKISLFSGGSELNPEKMNSFQIGTILNWKNKGIKYEINCYYNKVKDLVYYNPTGQGGKTFANSGNIDMGGVETVFHYNREKILLNVNSTYQYPFKVENFSSEDHRVSNVPRYLFNATIQYRLAHFKKGKDLWLRAQSHAQDAINCLTNDLVKSIQGQGGTTYVQKGFATFGAGIEWGSKEGISLSLDMNNLTNTQYEIGGQLLKGVPGMSRGFMFRATYKL